LGLPIADDLNLALLEPPLDWLTRVPPEYLHRNVQCAIGNWESSIDHSTTLGSTPIIPRNIPKYASDFARINSACT
jgi:hypothetical protein